MRRDTARLDVARAAPRPADAGTAAATPPGPRPGRIFAILAVVSLVAQLHTMACYALASGRGHTTDPARLASFWPFPVLALGHAVGQAVAWLAGFDITRQRGVVGTVARGLVPTAVLFIVLGPLVGSLALASLPARSRVRRRRRLAHPGPVRTARSTRPTSPVSPARPSVGHVHA